MTATLSSSWAVNTDAHRHTHRLTKSTPRHTHTLSAGDTGNLEPRNNIRNNNGRRQTGQQEKEGIEWMSAPTTGYPGSPYQEDTEELEVI